MEIWVPLVLVMKAAYEPFTGGAAVTFALVVRVPAFSLIVVPVLKIPIEPFMNKSVGLMLPWVMPEPAAVMAWFPALLMLKVRLPVTAKDAPPNGFPTLWRTKMGPLPGDAAVMLKTIGWARVMERGDPLPPEKLRLACPKTDPVATRTTPRRTSSDFFMSGACLC